MDYKPQSSLSNASKFMGLVAIITCFFGIGFVFGTLAIIFAILSKNKDNEFTRDGKLGAALGTVTIVLTIALIVFVLVNPTAHALLNEQCQSIYQMSFDEMIEAIKNGKQIQLPNSPMFLHSLIH